MIVSVAVELLIFVCLKNIRGHKGQRDKIGHEPTLAVLTEILVGVKLP
jgi:hypothetical protein